MNRLLERGFAVRALVRSEAAAAAVAGRGIEPRRGDLTDAESLRRACDGCAAVIHAAALLDDPTLPRELMLSVNAAGTESLTLAAIEAGAGHLVFVSSAVVYGEGPLHGVNEDAPLVPHSPYSESKIEAEAILERLAREGTIGITIFRAYWVYGPRDKRFLPFLRRILDLETIPLMDGGRALLDVVEVTDLADAMVLAIEKQRPGSSIFNISDGVPHTVRQIVDAAARATSRTPRFADTTAELLRDRVRSGELPITLELVDWVSCDHHLDTKRLHQELGFRASVALDEGLRRALASR